MYVSPFEAPSSKPSDIKDHPQSQPLHMITTQASDDVLSELLIAQLLEEDLSLAALAQEAERIQLEQALSESNVGNQGKDPAGKRELSSSPEASMRSMQTDSDIALRTMASEARLASDTAYAQELQRLQNAGLLADEQVARKWAAAEVKLMLDAEFARKLQEMDEEGEDTDDPQLLDVESVLGRDTISNIMVRDPNNKGKGKGGATKAFKGKGVSQGPEGDVQKKTSGSSPYRKCGICMDPFQVTHSPISAIQSANSSARLPFGLCLPCPDSHPYCLECIASYINSKLDPDGNGNANPNTVVFPIKCPECDLNEWSDGIPDDLAVRVLDERLMGIWHHQKLLDSLPKYYCPNPKCSILLQTEEDVDDPQATCPACNAHVCMPCRVMWHENFTCEEFQALPLDERSPEDQQALQLMKAQNWRRCPKCSVIVELETGCNHIECRCGTHFCFKCGALWDVLKYKCTRKPSCELWDEEMLFEEGERRRQGRLAGAPRAENRPPPQPPQPQPQPQPIHHQAPPRYEPPAIPFWQPRGDVLSRFDWMLDGGLKGGRQFFTKNMIATLTCQYCFARLTSLADLRYHLSHTTKHPVYACCGRFFKTEADFQKHATMKWGDHENQVTRLLDE